MTIEQDRLYHFRVFVVVMTCDGGVLFSAGKVVENRAFVYSKHMTSFNLEQYGLLFE